MSRHVTVSTINIIIVSAPQDIILLFNDVQFRNFDYKTELRFGTNVASISFNWQWLFATYVASRPAARTV